MRSRYIGLALLCCTVAAEQCRADAPSHYTYFWVPRSTDVGAPGSNDNKLLTNLLRLASTKRYSVTQGDTLDFLIRKKFLLSSSNYSNAYRLYYRRILQLNADLHPNQLSIGMTLTIPSGPTFGASEFNKDKGSPFVPTRELLNRLAATAVGSSQIGHIKSHSTAMLGAYVSPYKQDTPSEIFKAIESRGLVPPIDVEKHPETRLALTQALMLQATSMEDQKTLAAIGNLSPADLHRGFFPATKPAAVSCAGCKTCKEILNIPANLDLSRARVLIEDTGIAAGILDKANLLPQYDGDDGADLDGNSHGTFVFSEIAAPGRNGEAGGKGAIPRGSVYVSRVVQKVGNDIAYSMAYMLKGWQAFQQRITSDKSAATTGIINISAASGLDPADSQPPTVLENPSLLFVAAAGNDNSNVEPKVYAFGRFSGGGVPLILVGAQDINGKRASYSNYSSTNVHLMEPGDCVCGSPSQLSGTSQAAPVVTSAAAILASQRPQWEALDIMWKLLSTADAIPGIDRNGVFSGAVNLNAALEESILVKSQDAGEPLKAHRVSQITFDEKWKSALKDKALDGAGMPLLRIFNPHQIGNQKCFDFVQFITIDHQELCVDPSSGISFDEGGAKQSVSADRLVDMVLPLPKETDSNLAWPTIGMLPNGGG